MSRRLPYPPLREYAAIGDGRTVALVALDGSIDWLCLPNLDSPSVFAAILDAERGGHFTLRPREPHEARRRYLPDTNVLETTFTTSTGMVRVTDTMTLPGHGLSPSRELVRRIEGLSGHVPMTWRVEPRFGYGSAPVRLEGWRRPYPVATSGSDALAVCAWDAGSVHCDVSGIGADLGIREGARATIAIVGAHGEPLVFPSRAQAEGRAAATVEFWRRWAADVIYTGPWRDAVVRSALVLKLLVFAPSGAIAAAPTTSLPETIGGERNWDYRYSWIRDSSFTLEALLQLGKQREATAFFWWFMHATRLTLPRLQVLYRLDGGADAAERTLALDGYRGSRPVRIGNGAAGQLQLDAYGELLDAAFVYATAGHHLGRDTARDLASIADFVCRHWREPDSGIWEVRAAPRHHTQSKALCWVALDRAVRMAHMDGFRTNTPSAGAPRRRRFAASSMTTAGLKQRTATSGTPEAKTWMPACSSWRSCGMTPQTPFGCGARSKRFGGSWLQDRYCTDIRETTEWRAERGLSSAAHSGLRRRWRSPAGPTRRKRFSIISSDSPTTSVCTPRKPHQRRTTSWVISRKVSSTWHLSAPR